MMKPNINDIKSNIKRAIETCKGKSTNDSEKFLLISGGFSGIQDTVYTITSKGALKSLRARSFMLEFLCEHICYELVYNCFKDYKKYLNHVIYSGGGSFCILLPNNEENISNIDKIKEAINDWAFEEFSGAFFVTLRCLKLTEADLTIERFRGKWIELSRLLEDDKRKKFAYKLDKIFTDGFVKKKIYQRTNSHECQICHRDNIDMQSTPLRVLGKNNVIIKTIDDLEKHSEDSNNIIAHEMCYQLYVLGDQLTNISFISRITKLENGADGYLQFKTIDNSNVFYTLENNPKNKCLWKINPDTNVDYVPFMFADYVTKVDDLPPEVQKKEESAYEEVHGKEVHGKKMDKKRTTASFLGLSNSSCGADLLGCLRMDVDDLGKLFTSKLKNYELAVLSYISRTLNYFFKVVLNDICRGNVYGKYETTDLTTKGYKERNGRYVSVIYSGGDDLFILGAWDETAELAFDIQRGFDSYQTEYIGKIYEDIKLTISAGLTVYKDKYPLYQMAKFSKEALEDAKTFKYSKEDKSQKNKVCLFYSPIYKYKSNNLNIEAKKNIENKQVDYYDKFVYALKWNEDNMFLVIKSLLDFCEKQGDKMVLKDVSKGLIYKLFSLTETWWVKNSLYVPHLFYILDRFDNTSSDLENSKIKKLRDLIVKMPLTNKQPAEKRHEVIKYLKIPLTWFELLLRNKGE